MDDCFTLVKAQDEEARSALVIRKCMSLFSKFIRSMDAADDPMGRPYWKRIGLEKVSHDLIIIYILLFKTITHYLHLSSDGNVKLLSI
jgi:hypothetical protein